MGSIGNGAAPFEDYTTPRQGYARKLAEFLLQEYFFIPLDIFRKRIENRSEKAIETELEKVMSVYSKELAELDRNTVRYMMDEMQAEIDRQAGKLKEQADALIKRNQKIEAQAMRIHELEEKLRSHVGGMSD